MGKKMKKIGASSWVGVIMTCVFVFMVGLWQMDMSVSAMNMGSELENLLVTNPDPVFTYHLGLLAAVISFAAVVFIAIHHILPDGCEKGGGISET